jgi:hypothetical protein
MKLILTSFGLSHLTRESHQERNVFYRMPPVSMSHISEKFMPDYSTLLLTDKIIIDNETYNRLISDYHPVYKDVSLMIRNLYDEGFVQIEDFNEVVKSEEPFLEQMLERDLKEVELWVNPLKESMKNWETFINKFNDDLRNEIFKDNIEYHTEDHLRYHHYSFTHEMHYAMHYKRNQLSEMYYLVESLNSSTKRKKSEYRDVLKKHLIDYLSYINTNLLLSYKFDAGFHDWQDFHPFYREKFIRIGRDSSPAEKEIQNINKLFEISFPEFSNWRPKSVIKALKDKRITELRTLVDSACNGEIEFDTKFANSILTEVFKIESNISKIRNIVSYITLPLGFIPVVGTPIQKVIEESILQPIQYKQRKKFRWFYMISELANSK